MPIEGLKIKKVISHHDNRGFFAELIKFGEETFHEIKQTSYAETKPGIIKAFHIHDYWESWCIVKGSAKIVLADIREKSPTKGEKEVIYVNGKDLLVIAIPPNVAHGYEALGNESMGIIYYSAEAYNPDRPVIETIPYDSPLVGFNWEKKQ